MSVLLLTPANVLQGTCGALGHPERDEVRTPGDQSGDHFSVLGLQQRSQDDAKG